MLFYVQNDHAMLYKSEALTPPLLLQPQLELQNSEFHLVWYILDFEKSLSRCCIETSGIRAETLRIWKRNTRKKEERNWRWKNITNKSTRTKARKQNTRIEWKKSWTKVWMFVVSKFSLSYIILQSSAGSRKGESSRKGLSKAGKKVRRSHHKISNSKELF